MKIICIVGQFPKLSETFILNQITGLLDQGQEVELLALRESKEKQVHNDIRKYGLEKPDYCLQMPSGKIERALRGMVLLLLNFYKAPAKFLKALNIFEYGRATLSLQLLYACAFFIGKEIKGNIIHCHFGPNGTLGIFLRDAGLAQGKIITSFHGFDLSSFIKGSGKQAYKALISRGDIFTVNSEYLKNRLVKLGCKPEKIIIHPIGIDVEKFSFQEKKLNNEETIKILSVARLTEKKGLEYSIKAIANIIKKHPNLEYNIAGDGPLKRKLENLISDLEIKGKVKFLGPQPQAIIRKLYAESHLFVLSSVTAKDGDQEGTPVTLLEAQASGLPVVSTFHAGIPEIVQNGKSGFLIPEKDVSALTDKINYLIEHPEIWPKMGQAGRNFIEARHNIDQLNKNLIEIYKRML